MKQFLYLIAVLVLFCFSSYARETTQVKVASSIMNLDMDNHAIDQMTQIESKKELKKARKAKKRAEKEAKKQQRLVKNINKKRKSIDKNERKIKKLQSKLLKQKTKGKLTRVDELEMNQKIDKVRIDILKEKEKLAKLERKQ